MMAGRARRARLREGGTVTWVALLRGVNVGGRRPVAMAGLRQLLVDLGFDRPRSVLQSGNLVFGARARSAAVIERAIEQAVDRRFGLETAVFVRSSAEWRRLMAANPFPDAAEHDPARLLVMCLRTAPAAGRLATLRSAIAGREQVEIVGLQAYLVYPDGIGRSKLTNAVIERHLGSAGTARNWNTVIKLAAAGN